MQRVNELHFKEFALERFVGHFAIGLALCIGGTVMIISAIAQYYRRFEQSALNTNGFCSRRTLGLILVSL